MTTPTQSNTNQPITIIPQAVYGDPMTDGLAGGNSLAYSESVQSQEATQLSKLAGVPDPEDAERYPCPYYSFMRLKSGNYIVTQRFVASGLRRGVARILAHSLILTEEFLNQHHWEVEGIQEVGCFSLADQNNSKVLSFTQLQKEVGKKNLSDLSDLHYNYYSSPEDFRAQALKIFCDKQKKLRQDYGLPYGLLRTYITGAVISLMQGKRVVLPKFRPAKNDPPDVVNHSYEYLLSLIWYSLPPLDRRAVSWGTFPWLGLVVVTFQLSNSPDPLGANDVGLDALTKIANQDTVLENLVAKYVPEDIAQLDNAEYTKQLLKLRTGLWQHQLSLHNSPKLQAWIAFTTDHDQFNYEQFVNNGCTNIDAFKQVMVKIRKSGFGLNSTPPWLENLDILRGICITGLNLIQNYEDVTAARNQLKQLYQVLNDGELEILVPDRVWLLQRATEMPKLEGALIVVAQQLLSNKPSIRYVELLNTLSAKAQDQAARGSSFQNQYAALLSLVRAELGFMILSNTSVPHAEINENAFAAIWKAVLAPYINQSKLLEELVDSSLKLAQITGRLLRILWELASRLQHQVCLKQLLPSLIDFLHKHPKWVQESWLENLPTIISESDSLMLVRCLELPDPAFKLAATALHRHLMIESYASQCKHLSLQPKQIQRAWHSYGKVTDWVIPVWNVFDTWDKESRQSDAELLAIEWCLHLASARTETLSGADVDLVIKMLDNVVPKYRSQWKTVVTKWIQLRISEIHPGEEAFLHKLYEFARTYGIDNYLELGHKLEVFQIRKGKLKLKTVFMEKFPFSQQAGLHYIPPAAKYPISDVPGYGDSRQYASSTARGGRLSQGQDLSQYMDLQQGRNVSQDYSLYQERVNTGIGQDRIAQNRITQDRITQDRITQNKVTKDKVTKFLQDMDVSPKELLEILNTPLLMTRVLEQNIVEWYGSYIFQEFLDLFSKISWEMINHSLLLSMARYTFQHRNDPNLPEPLKTEFYNILNTNNATWAIAILDGDTSY